mmetsp:Transcript_83398/g.239538  ORF Transcript_83398/g.239538 Transcript_83398/m.239538 type:complete len:787 (-) Transcript_83398:36-2396(-)
MGDSVGTDALQVHEQSQTALAKLAPQQLSQDVRRERASLEPSPFGWSPVWNRTQLSSYFHNRGSDATRLGDTDSRGRYRIIHLGPIAVHSKVNNVHEGDIDTLWQSRGVEVLAVVLREDVHRIRARIKTPPGWISLQNLDTNYRYAVKADLVILISGVTSAPEINGLYERDAHETERGGSIAYPRYKQVNGKHYIRVTYDEAPIWMITIVRSGPVGDNLRCDSAYHHDTRPITVDSLPPTWPGAWRSVGVGVPGPMPSLVITHANEGDVKTFPGKAFPKLGILSLHYPGYDPEAEEVDSWGAMGYLLLYRRIPLLTPAVLESGQPLAANLERNIIGAMERLEQMGAKGIVGDCAAMMSFQTLAATHSGRPPFMSPLVQWLIVSSTFAKADKFLILTNSEQALRSHTTLLKATCRLDLADERFILSGCEDIPNLRAVQRDEEVPSQGVEDAVVRIAQRALEEHKDLRGVFIESTELLPYTDDVRKALGLPVWDAVNLCDLHYAARPEYSRFEVSDWMQRLTFEIGRNEGRGEGPPRKLAVVSLDYENVRVPRHWNCHGSIDYEILFMGVVGLTRYLTSLGKLTHACEKGLSEAIKFMQKEGCCGITGDCGFMMAYQIFARDHAEVPVFMSPMVMGSAILSALDKNLKVMIITADEKALKDQKKVLKEIGCIDLTEPRYVIVGCEEFQGMEKLAAKGEIAEMATVLQGVLNTVGRMVKEWPTMGVHVGAILLECAHLLPCSELLRKETGLPVYDAISCCEFFASARQDYDRFGIKQWPYAWDRSIEEE